MQSFRKAFTRGSTSNSNDAGRLIEGSENPGATSSRKSSSGFWGVMLRDAEKEKIRDQEIVRAEIQDIQGKIYRATSRLTRILDSRDIIYDDSSLRTAIRLTGEVTQWIGNHKRGLDLSEQDHQAMKKEGARVEKELKWYQGIMSGRTLSKIGYDVEEVQRADRQRAFSKTNQIMGDAQKFLKMAQERLNAWSSQDASQSQSADHQQFHDGHDGQDELGLPQQADPFM